MEDESQLLASQLGGFALDAFLGEFTGDTSIRASGLQALNGSGNVNGNSVQSRVDASLIFDGDEKGARYEDGDDEDGDDFEDEVDREINAEDAAAAAAVADQVQLPAMPAMPLLKGKMRGEDDDFDADDDDENGGKQHQQPHQTSMTAPLNGSLFFPQQQAGSSSSNGLPSFPPLPNVQIKQEDAFDEIVQQQLRLQLPQSAANQMDDAEAAELAAQQALFQQSYARMQTTGTQILQPVDGMADFSRQPSPPVMVTATLYPSFAADKVLDFTELFVPRPRKRPRIDPTAELRPFNSCEVSVCKQAVLIYCLRPSTTAVKLL